MHTNTLLSRFVTTGTRLVILAAMLMAAFISSVTPASAATVPFDLYAVTGTTTLAGADRSLSGATTPQVPPRPNPAAPR